MSEQIDITFDLLLTDLDGVTEVRLYKAATIDKANLGTPLATLPAGTTTYTDTVDFGSVNEYLVENYSTTASAYSNVIAVNGDEDISFMAYNASRYKPKSFNTRGDAIGKDTPDYSYARAMDVAPNNVYFLAGNYNPTRYDGNVMTWEAVDKGVGAGADYAIVYDARGFVYAGGSGKYLRQYNATTGVLNWETSTTDAIYAITVDLYGRIIVACGNVVRCFGATGTQVWEFNAHTSTVNAVQASKDGSYVSGSADNSVIKFSELGDGSLSIDWSVNMGYTIYQDCLSYNSKQNKVIAITNTKLRLINFADGSIEADFTIPNYGGCLLSDSGLIYVYSISNGLYRYDNTGTVVWERKFNESKFTKICSTPGAQGNQLGIYSRATAPVV